MSRKSQKIEGWGVADNDGSEVWDTNPVFTGPKVTWQDKLKLLFYPKKFLLYRYIYKQVKKQTGKVRILDVGCGTGATIIDLKKLFGRSVEVMGVDVVHLQVDLARDKLKQAGVWAEVKWYDGKTLPFVEESFTAIYTSDVLGHVADVQTWLHELNRVLKPGGVLAMFSESKLGKQAWVRNYLFKRGLNVDPHEKYHISLYSKAWLREYLEEAGFVIKKIYSAFWASFLVHPDEFYEKLQGQKKFPVLRLLNRMLSWLKKKTHPVSTALAELYGLIEMLTLGRWVEAQGYIILARKKK